MLKSVLTSEEKSALVRAELEPFIQSKAKAVKNQKPIGRAGFIQSKAQSVKNHTKIRNEPDFSNDDKIKTEPISVESDNEISNNDISLSQEKRLKENEKMCMSFSNFPEEYKEQFMPFFKSKGVRISSEVLCDPGATHVVSQKMSRSEKMLGSIASGKWILHPSYVEACMAANEILSNFTDFEWGNPEKDFMQEINAKDQQLAKTAFRLRQFICKNPSKGPFTRLRAIIHTTDTRSGARFARLH